eukprot:GILI01020023.1.p1 GENE.GILI01020023.1~~GILI01020023.1.p1  ORF type:complete len:217 (-),score=30.36 GILI01020023.1:819-1469(-)
MDVYVQNWTERFPFVGYGIVEEVAFNFVNKTSESTEVEIETFLKQMNELNRKNQQSSSPLLKSSSLATASANDHEDDSDTEASQQLIVFTTSITSSRRVRDHDRQIRNLLYLLKLPCEFMDVADNKFVQNQVVKMIQNALKNDGGGFNSKLPASANDLRPHAHNPPALLEHCLPIVFFNQQLIGTFLDIQYFVDDEPNHATLQRVLSAAGSTLKVS